MGSKSKCSKYKCIAKTACKANFYFYCSEKSAQNYLLSSYNLVHNHKAFSDDDVKAMPVLQKIPSQIKTFIEEWFLSGYSTKEIFIKAKESCQIMNLPITFEVAKIINYCSLLEKKYTSKEADIKELAIDLKNNYPDLEILLKNESDIEGIFFYKKSIQQQFMKFTETIGIFLHIKNE